MILKNKYMFTGIIEEIGTITKKTIINEGLKFSVRSKLVGKKLAKSDSVCINGVCHTVTAKSTKEFEFVSMHETLKKTNIGELNIGDKVNLEGSMRLNKELGGHIVAGHIDDTGVITNIKQVKSLKGEKSNNWEYRIRIHKKHVKNVIYVGSIAVDGVSLTVAEVSRPKGNYFYIKVAVIPYTYNNTIFSRYKIGEKVNLEFDLLGKYVVNLIETNPKIMKIMK